MGRKRKEEESVVSQIEEEEESEDKKPVRFVSSGCDILDFIGGGGFPFGKIVNIIGDNSTGKTLLVSEFIAFAYSMYKDDLEWFYDDAEAGYSFDSKKIWGIDIVADEDDCSETLEDFQIRLYKMCEALKPGKKLIYVLDSFDSLTTIEEIDYNHKKMKAIEDEKKLPGTYGQSKAKGMSEFFRAMRKKIKEKEVILVIISQVRENIGVSFGAKYKRMGGKALDFYAAQIFWLAVAEKYEESNRVCGIGIKARTSKNKVGKPFREGIFDILFDYGIDNISSNIKYLYGLKTDEGKDKEKINKSELEWNGEKFSFRKLIRHIEANNLVQELYQKTKEKWDKEEEKSDMSIGRKPKYSGEKIETEKCEGERERVTEMDGREGVEPTGDTVGV